MAELLSLDRIRAAARRIAGVARVTPLFEVRELGAWGGQEPPVPLFLKCENLQVGGVFKTRGAFNMASSLPESAARGPGCSPTRQATTAWRSRSRRGGWAFRR